MGSGHSTSEAAPGIGGRAEKRLRERQRRREAKSARALHAHQSARARHIRRHHKVGKRHLGELDLDRWGDEDGRVFSNSATCKVAIVGPRRAGKSSIFRRFLTNTFVLGTQHDSSANVGLRLVELEGCVPIWFEVWDLPTHVPLHGNLDGDRGGGGGGGGDGGREGSDARLFSEINAWETHTLEGAYRDELKREHTDPSTGLVKLLKKDHDAVLLTIEASVFSSYELDATIDALITDAAFLNDHTRFEIMHVIVVTKCDLLSDEEMEGVLIQVRSVAEDKGIDFVTTSARYGSKSIRDVFKYVARHTVVSAESAEREHQRGLEEEEAGAAAAAAEGREGGGGGGDKWEEARPAPKMHQAHPEFGGDMTNLFTMNHSR